MPTPIRLPLPVEIRQVVQTLQHNGFMAYVVGGCLRDLLLEREPRDWDVATSASPPVIARLFPKTFYENAYGTVTVVNEATGKESLKHVEVTPFRKESTYSDKRHPDRVSFGATLEEDLARRDFTVNALAYDPTSQEIIDLYGGRKDIKEQIIRAVGNPEDRFTEDALRMIRAVRIASELNFVISRETAEAISKYANFLSNIAVERLRDELIKIIISPNPLLGLALGQKLGLWGKTIPELDEMVHVKQNKDHKYDVWEHTLRAVQHAADKNYPLEVRLGALFHDIGKPRSKEWNKEKQDWTFYGHDVLGAKIAQSILKKLRFPTKQMENIVKLARYHMFFTDTDKITLSAVRRMVKNVGQDLIWRLMEVRICDRIGMGRPKESPYRLRKYWSMIEEASRAPTSVSMLKINGREVMEITGLPPSPKIGFILHALLEEVLEKPELNFKKFMLKRAKELAKLQNLELQKLAAKGKERKEKLEKEEILKIRARFHVK